MSAPNFGDYGRLVHAVTLDRELISFFQTWLPTYLSATEQRENKPTRWLARPAFYATLFEEDDQDHLSDRRMPAVFVTTGDAIDWIQTGTRIWSAFYRTMITVVMRGRTPVEARLQAAMYAATITELMLGKPALGGIANGLEVVSERLRPVEDPSNRQRHLVAAMGEYLILVPEMRVASPGPLTPNPPDDPDQPFVPLPDVDEVLVDVVGLSPPSLPEED